MSTTPPNQPPFNPGGPNAPGFDPKAPYDPTNVNDPRYDPSRDPRFDPRWQKAQQRFYRDQQRMADRQGRAQQKAAAAAWKAQARAQRDGWRMYWQAQRRTSLVGPILLITIGVIFFLLHTGRVSPMAFFGWYGHWWPLVFIGIGLLRLMEWGVDRMRAPQDAPPMRYSVGGGVVFVLIVLAVLGMATHTLQWRADQNGLRFFGFQGEGMEHLFGQKHEEDSAPALHAIAAGGSLSIENPRGDVSVSGTSDDGQVHLSVHKSVYTNSDSVATDRLGDLTPVFEGTNDNLTVRVPQVQGTQADLTLLVPASTHVLLNNTRGDVHASNLKAPLVVTSNNGNIEIAAITGPVQVHTSNRHNDVDVRSVTGDVTVDGSGDEVTLQDITGAAMIHGDFFGGGHVQRASGRVEYNSSRTSLNFTKLYGDFSIDGDDVEADQVVGPALIQTRSRNITLSKVTGDLKIVNNHGDVKIDAAPPVGAMTIDNQNGSVTLTLPEKSKFNLQGETTDGETHSDFSGITSDGRGSLRGEANGGGAQLRVNTSHGDITISRNVTTPLTPPPPMPKLTGDIPAVPDVPSLPDVSGTSKEAVQQAREQARQATRDAKEQARQAMQQAHEAMKEAQQKQREAERLAREAAKSN